jgi:hypothetical protein
VPEVSSTKLRSELLTTVSHYWRSFHNRDMENSLINHCCRISPMFAPTLSSLGAGEAPRMTGGCTEYGRLWTRSTRIAPRPSATARVSPFTLGLTPASGASPPLFPVEAKSNLAVSPSTQLCRQPPTAIVASSFHPSRSFLEGSESGAFLWAHFTLSERSISQTSHSYGYPVSLSPFSLFLVAWGLHSALRWAGNNYID